MKATNFRRRLTLASLNSRAFSAAKIIIHFLEILELKSSFGFSALVMLASFTSPHSVNVALSGVSSIYIADLQ